MRRSDSGTLAGRLDDGMGSAIPFGGYRNWHIEPPFVIAFTASHPDADGAAVHRCSSHEGHTGDLLAAWTRYRKLLAITNRVGHYNLCSLQHWSRWSRSLEVTWERARSRLASDLGWGFVLPQADES